MLAVVLQSVGGGAPRRDEYTYDANGILVRVDVGDNFAYNTFTYEDGRLESIKMFGAANDELSREIKYFYDQGNGKLARREIHQADLTYYELYEYPADNIMEVLTFDVDDEGNVEQQESIIHAMDNKPNVYPKEWFLEYAAWGGIITPNNVISYQVVENGVTDETRFFASDFQYNRGGYPTSKSMFGNVVETYTYSCEPVKEQ